MFYTYVGNSQGKILHRYIEDDERHTGYDDVIPMLCSPTRENTGFTNLHGAPVKPKYYNSIKQFRDACDMYSEIDNTLIYGSKSIPTQYIDEKYPDQLPYNTELIKGFILDIEVFSDDGFPQPEEALHPVTAITVYCTIAKKFYVFGYHPTQTFEHNTEHKIVGGLDVIYSHCTTEIELLRRFIAFWQFDIPDWVSGWHSKFFDMPYLHNRICILFGEKEVKKLSPFKSVYRGKVRETYNGQVNIREKIVIKGVEELDYLDLYKKHTFTTQESYKLDHIAFVELKEKKLEYEGSLANLWLDDFQTYMEYNIHDVNLIRRLDNKLKLFDITYTLAYFAKINFSETLSPVKTWESLVYHHLRKDNKFAPIRFKPAEKNKKFKGAYVKEPVAGFYRWVVSVDLNSLYPHLIQQYNVGVDTIIEPEMYNDEIRNALATSKITENKLLNKKVNTQPFIDNDVVLAANGTLYRKDEMSLLSIIMRDLYAGRKADKKQMLAYEQELENLVDPSPEEKKRLEYLITKFDNLQMAKKILLNSGYGALGSPYFSMFDIRVAEAITLGGRLSILFIADRLNELFNKMMETKKEEYVFYIDTDSNYIVMDKIVEKYFPNKTTSEIVDLLDEMFNTHIKKFMDDAYEQLATYMNAYEQRMFMDREVIAENAVWTKKKRYAMAIWDKEGVRYDKLKFKVMGLDSVRSTLPVHARKVLKECYEIVLTGDNDQLIQRIKEYQVEYMKMPLNDISMPKGCNGVTKYADKNTVFMKGTPMHVKGALIHNKMVKDLGLENEIELIKNGDKVRIMELKKINPTEAKVICFLEKLPKEFDLDRFIDKRVMFRKSFLDPLDNFIRAVGWTNEKKNSMLKFIKKVK